MTIMIKASQESRVLMNMQMTSLTRVLMYMQILPLLIRHLMNMQMLCSAPLPAWLGQLKLFLGYWNTANTCFSFFHPHCPPASALSVPTIPLPLTL